MALGGIMHHPEPQAIRAELARILSSTVFKKSTVLSNFLRYVVDETLDNKVDGIKEYSIAVKALGRPADFNPQIDALIRIHAGRLRRLLLEYYTEEGYNDPINILLNRGSYVPEFSIREVTKQYTAPLSSMRVDNNSTVKRVAVLPFRNLSGSSENDFMVDGFCEQLSSDLAQFPEIEVIAYYSTSRFRAERLDIREVGRELNVSHLISGSIYRNKSKLRISMQLISAISGTQLWTQTFERSINSTYLYDLFDDIIKQVAPKLTGYYGLISRSSSFSTQIDPYTHSESIDAVFWYYHYQIKYTEETFQTARTRIENALLHNPNYALGWGILSQLYLDGEALCYTTVDDPLREAEKCIVRALQLDHDCQHAYFSLAWLSAFRRDKDKAISTINKCISINPKSSFFLGLASFIFGIQGEYELSLKCFDQAYILNPYYPWWINLGNIFMHFYNGNYEAALEFSNRINIPGVIWNDLFRISALGQLDLIEQAREKAKRFQEQFSGKAVAANSILQTVLFHKLVQERIKDGLIKAGLTV